MKYHPALALLLAIMPTSLLAQQPAVTEHLFDPVDGDRSRKVPIKVYLPMTEKALPVVIFSHGLGGARTNNPYLGNHWAEAGYVAVFTQHLGSDEAVWKDVPLAERMKAMGKAANIQNTLNRYRDIPFVIDELEKWNVEEGHALFGKLDLEHIGLSGHSFGAVTSQGLMGQNFPVKGLNFRDERIDAFILMSPSANRGLSPGEAFGHITSPVLAMTGTEDVSEIGSRDVDAANRLSVYPAFPEGDKYQLVFEEGKHNAFSDSKRYNPNRVPHHHPAIQKIATAFWDAYLKGDATAKAWLQSEKPKTDAKLIEKDRWEWK